MGGKKRSSKKMSVEENGDVLLETPGQGVSTRDVSAQGISSTPEALLTRLGDILLDKEVITPEELERALVYQQELAAQGQPCLLGQALLRMELIDREKLDEVITEQLARLQNALLASNRQLEQRVEQRTRTLEQRLVQIRTAAEVTQLALSASSLDDLMHRAVELIVERFGYYHAAIFLVDDHWQKAVLRAYYGPASRGGMKETVPEERVYSLEVGSKSMIGWVTLHNLPRVSADVSLEEYYQADESLPDTRSEVTIPITIGDRILGALDVQDTLMDAFDTEAVAVLQTISNHIASVIQTFALLEATQTNLKLLTTLYQASQQITQAATVKEVISATVETLRQAAFSSIVWMVSQKGLQVHVILDIEAWLDDRITEINAEVLTAPLPVAEAIKIFSDHGPILINSLARLPRGESHIVDRLLAVGIKTAAFIPIFAGEALHAVIAIVARNENDLTAQHLQPFYSLAQLARTAIEKILARQKAETHLSALQSLNTISQAVLVETDMYTLYQAIHNEVKQLMGEVNFSIATYDPKTELIQIPYMHDGKELRVVDPFPIGQGLISQVIETRQPLLISQDAGQKAYGLRVYAARDGEFDGGVVRSWLGVPLLISGEVLGAVIVQDFKHEGRFNEDDQRLMMTLAAQVAVAMRNARLLESVYRQAERERQLYEITNKIRSEVEMQKILEVTARELSLALAARRAHIEINGGSE